MNDRQLAAITDPLSDGYAEAVRDRHTYITRAGDDALITTILAVDR